MASGGWRSIRAAAATLLVVPGCERPARVAVPAGYPASYATTIEAAGREGGLLIWSAIDAGKAKTLLARFRARYPRVRVDYVELPARTINERFLAATRAGRRTPDLLWSSAMDLQIQLTNDGHAQRYVSPEAPRLPHWANWKDEAWGVTAEPIVMIYNRRLVADAAVPRTHGALAAWLERQRPVRGAAIATYDVEASAVGYLYLSQDAQASGDFWRLARAMGDAGVRRFVRAEDMLRAVARGEVAIGYDVVGSYAISEAARDPILGVVLFRDYTLLMSRIALIPTTAEHPAAARLFVDFLLSRTGQSLLAAQRMPSVRDDVTPVRSLQPPDVPLRAIRVGPGLLVIQDALTRAYFLRHWRAALTDDGPALVNARP